MNTDEEIKGMLEEAHPRDEIPFMERIARPLNGEMSLRNQRRLQRAKRNGGETWGIIKRNKILTGKIGSAVGSLGPQRPTSDRRALPGKKRRQARKAANRG